MYPTSFECVVCFLYNLSLRLLTLCFWEWQCFIYKKGIIFPLCQLLSFLSILSTQFNHLLLCETFHSPTTGRIQWSVISLSFHYNTLSLIPSYRVLHCSYCQFTCLTSPQTWMQGISFISMSILNTRVPGNRCVLHEGSKEEIK